MEIQISILRFFESLHCPALTAVFKVITMMGVDIPLVAILFFIYWNINKKKGFAACMNMLGAVTAMNVMKAIVRFPRPWTVIEGLDSIQENATGYSFPSGHTTCAASSYGAIAYTFKKKWLSIICAILIALIGISRLYLCVHWPLDIVGGLLIGCGSTFLFVSAFMNAFDKKEEAFQSIRWIALICGIVGAVLSILVTLQMVDEDAFSDLSKNLTLVSGGLVGYIMERKRTDFIDEEGQWGKKILRYVIGMVGILFFFVVLKTILVKTGLYNCTTACLRYFLSGVWACGVFPILGVKWGLFKTEA